VREFTAKISTMSNTPRNDLITTMGESLRSGAGAFSAISHLRRTELMASSICHPERSEGSPAMYRAQLLSRGFQREDR
jgi:hypothetical protein